MTFFFSQFFSSRLASLYFSLLWLGVSVSIFTSLCFLSVSNIFYFFSLIHIVNSSRSASFQPITVFTSLSLSGSRHTMVHVLVTAFFVPSHQLLVKPHITSILPAGSAPSILRPEPCLRLRLHTYSLDPPASATETPVLLALQQSRAQIRSPHLRHHPCRIRTLFFFSFYYRIFTFSSLCFFSLYESFPTFDVQCSTLRPIFHRSQHLYSRLSNRHLVFAACTCLPSLYSRIHFFCVVRSFVV